MAESQFKWPNQGPMGYCTKAYSIGLTMIYSLERDIDLLSLLKICPDTCIIQGVSPVSVNYWSMDCGNHYSMTIKMSDDMLHIIHALLN